MSELDDQNMPLTLHKWVSAPTVVAGMTILS
jgi:hypothetical protein